MSIDKYYEDFGITKLKDKKALSEQKLYNLYKTPKKDKGLNMPRIQVFEENAVHQADILFLPHDGAYKYALVVVDGATRKVDAEPLKGKSADEILIAFKKIYGRNVLKLPTRLEVDSGGEFKGSVKKYFTDKGVFIRYGQPSRHRQQALVERVNQVLGKALYQRMVAQEMLTGEKETRWIEDLPVMTKAINKERSGRKKKVIEDPVCEGQSCNLLEIGTKVRVQLDEPIDLLTGEKLHGHFRSTDIRWNPKIRVIKEILIRPGQPPMYLLDGKIGKRDITPIAYTQNQLQKVPESEKAPLPKVIRGKPNTYIVEKIMEKKKEKNKIYYRVRWLGYSAKDDTWEPRSELIKDVPELVGEYEKR